MADTTIPNIEVAFAGNASVGKTSLIKRVVCQDWDAQEPSTIGIDFNHHVIRFEPLDTAKGQIATTEEMNFTFWDTAGQERFASIIAGYFRRRSYIFIVYAVDDRRSFENVGKWLDRVQQHASDETQYILIGTKADLERRGDAVQTREGRKLAKQLGFCYFAETSSKEKNANYMTPLEIMKTVAQMRWRDLEAQKQQHQDDIMATRAGYVTRSFPDGKMPLKLRKSSRKSTNCC